MILTISTALLCFQQAPRVRAQTADDVVMHAADATFAGKWSRQQDPTAASGFRMWHPNENATKVDPPKASPANYFELTFQADAGRAYHLWIRARAEGDNWGNDSVWVQFSDSVTSGGAPSFQIGSDSATDVNLEACSGLGVAAWGWQDNGWCDQPAPAIYFAAAGSHTVRVQTREDGVSVDQIVLSPATGDYSVNVPGPPKNDSTILTPNGTVGGGSGGGGSSLDEIVLYASDIQNPPVGWTFDSDPTAADSLSVHDANAGALKATQADDNPDHYFEITFDADATKTYRLWLRLRAEGDYWGNDSVWVQFSDTVDASGLPVYRINTTSGTSVNLEECSGCGIAAWGWQDDAYGVGATPAIPIRFASTGTHTIRVQRREDGVMIDQIVLSAVRYRNAAPGLDRNDTTIVPKPGAGNQAPTITSATATPTSGTAPLSVDFSATATDPENDQLQYAWVFGDGGTATGPAPSHTYLTPGSYSPVVTVTDGHNHPNRGAGSITVDAAGVAQIKFFHFNIHHGRSPNGRNNLDDVTRLIKESAAQVVSLNEVELKRSGYVYNGDPEDQPARIEDMLQTKTGRCWAQLRAPRNGDETATEQAQVNLLLWQTTVKLDGEICDASQGLELVGTAVHLLPDDPETGRSVGAVTLRVNGRDVTFMTTHLTYCTCVADGGSAARTAQIKELLKWSGLAFPAANQQIVGGDFNTHESNTQYKLMTGADTTEPTDDGFADGWKEAATKLPANYSGNTADGKRIDYFLRLRKSTSTTTRSFEVTEAPMRQDGTSNVSDHYPLMAVFEIR